MNQLKHILAPAALSILLTACGSDDDNSIPPITEDSYAVQLVSDDFSSSQVAIGNILGDRTARNVLDSNQSDYTVASYKQYLYHIGKYAIDTISRYSSTSSLEQEEWNYTTNEANTSDSSNTYELIQNADDNAYLVNYGNSLVLQIDPTATEYDNFVKDRIDLSNYKFDKESSFGSANLSGGAIINNTLFVIAQRLDGFNTTSETIPYLIAIDLSTNTEIDTDPQKDGLKGIPLNSFNPENIVAHNNTVYVSGRGNFDGAYSGIYESIRGGVDMIDATTFEVTNLVNDTTFSELNHESFDIYYHITDIAVVNDQKAYVSVNTEIKASVKSSLIYELDPSTQIIGEPISRIDYENKAVSDIAIDSENRLWISVFDSNDPRLIVMDTDTNTQSGDSIKLASRGNKIIFLDVE